MAEGHRERLKKRFLNEGLTNFEDYQALELLLFYAIPRKDTSSIARKLLDVFGSFSAVINAPVDELRRVDGIGECTAVYIKLLNEFCSYYMNDTTRYKKQLVTLEEVGEYLKNKFIGLSVEKIYLLCVDDVNRILYGDFISEGSVNLSTFDTRTIIEICIRVGATGIFLAHNHPRSFALPSKDDLEVTRELEKALRVLNISLIDHLVIADNDYVSMRCSNMFPQFPGYSGQVTIFSQDQSNPSKYKVNQFIKDEKNSIDSLLKSKLKNKW